MRTLALKTTNKLGYTIACLLVMQVCTDLSAQSICFSSHNDYTFEGTSNAQCIEYGDFDNDGIQDIIEGNFTIGANKMVFIKGNADGTFDAPVVFEGGSRPLDVKAYDFNQDMNLDLVVANQFDAEVSIVFGNGDGTFQTPVVYATNTSPNDIALGDFNEDGAMDFVVSCLSGGVNLFMGSTVVPGQFSLLGTVTMGAGARGVVAYDFDQDTHMDIATANNSAASMTVKYGDGTGGFGAPVTILAQNGTFAIQSGDFNNDGWQDLAVTNETANSLTVALNSSGGFSTGVSYPTKTSPNGIKVGDFNEDNLDDIAIVAFADNVVSVYLGIGAGAFGAGQSYTAIGAPRDLVVYNCNGDAHDDIVISTNVGQVLPVFLGLGTGDFQRRVSFPVGNGAESVYHGDMNGDTFEDVVVANKLDNNVQVLLNDGTGAFTSAGIYGTDLAPTDLFVADVNGDLFMDVVTVNNTNGNISVLTGNGTGSLSSLGNFNCNAGPVAIAMADLNNDGNIDVAVLNSTQDYNILFGTGTGAFGSPVTYSSGNNPSDLVLADFNNDNVPDIAFSLRGNNKIGVALNNGSGGFGATAQFNVGSQPTGIAAGYLNSDSNLDIVVSNYGSNNFSRLLGNGAGAFTPALNFSSTDTGPMDVELKDFNNDDILDVIGICEVSVASTGYAPVFVGTGTGTFTFYKRFSVDMRPEEITVADWDNDGRFDAAAVNSVSKSVSILKNTTAYITINGPTDYCEGDGTYLISTPADSYEWSSMETAQQISPATDGTYYVQTTTGFSSWCTSQSNSIAVTVSPSPALSLTSDLTICSGQSASLVASGADTYVWSGGLGTNPSIVVTPTASQWYVVTGSISGGCSKTDSVHVEVTTIPDASFTTLASTYCQNEPALTLVPATPGGVFSGPGVSGDQLDPASTAAGTISINYFIDLGGGCDNTSTQVTEIAVAPNANFTGLAATYCAGDADVSMVPVEAGGTFSGTGISGTQFSPATAGAGIYAITYDITNGQGCSDQFVANTTVFASPDASFSGLAATYCTDQSSTSLVPVTGGGTFSGSGVSGMSFDPSLATIGTNTVSYTVTNGNGCTAVSTATTEVVTAPDASFSGLAATYCTGDADVTLVPLQGGGTFSGSGIAGTQFSPSTAGPGTYTITYDITNGPGCTAQTTMNTTVHASPDATFSGLAAQYCTNETSATLSPVTGGGTFSGSGMSGTNFDPALAAVGSVTVTYSVTNGGGCTSVSTATTDVVAAPDATFSGLATEYCTGDADATLVPVETGGTFSGTGITGTQFSPSTAGAGSYAITYDVTNVQGCTDQSILNTTVFASPDATFSGLAAQYCTNETGATLVPITSGGTFSGSGMSGTNFDPALATVGSVTVTYTVTNGSSCTSVSTATTDVVAAPDATFSGLATEYCAGDADATLVPVETGGTFSGTGITGTQFSPSTAGTGSHSITYDITNADGCTDQSILNTTVFASPDATFSGLAAQYCTNETGATLVPITSGGTFSGSGMSGTNFDPALATVGSVTVTYSVTNGSSCTSVSTATTDVVAAPDATFSGLATEYCAGDADATLVPVETGGTFSGTGIAGTQFSPSTAGPGSYAITYDITNVQGCTDQSILNTTVFASPDATFSGLAAQYCTNEAGATLVPVTSGGTFSGSGMSGASFDPTLATVGSVTVTYSVTNGSSCTSVSTATTDVVAAPDATFSGLAPDYCTGDANTVLVPVEAGGSFSGTGVVGPQFSPVVAGAGTHTITYDITNADGCTAQSVMNTTVYTIPDATFSGLAAQYCTNEAAATLVPVEVGGTFSGSGTSGTTFDPSIATVGTTTVTYTITNGSSCTSVSSLTTDVIAAPDATFSGLATEYCAEDADATLVPVETGGTFSGTGMAGTQFSPVGAGPGAYSITYDITNADGCTAQSVMSTTVYAVPDATFAGLAAQYCSNESSATLVPVELGGTFSGSGTSGMTFDPSIATIGTTTVLYTITNANNCTSVNSQTTDVIAAPDATFSGLATEYCAEDADATLVPVETGGTFSGTGIVGTQFSPVGAGPGAYSITYDITNVNGCTSQSVVNTTVYAVPDAAFSGLAAQYCSDESIATLVPVETGGTFSGSGITGTDFDPGSATVGMVTVTYTITNTDNCTATSNALTEVIASPDAGFTGLAANYCDDAPVLLTLSPATVGGTFSGAGISGNQFNSATAGTGTHTVTYTITQNGCTSSTDFVTTVNTTPDASFSGLGATYCEQNQSVTLNPVVAGGVFSGAGVSGGVFNPLTAGAGTHTIVYDITGTGGCDGQSSLTTTVIALPDADFSGLNPTYCSSGATISTLVPVTSGGVFSGPGISGNQFSTALAGQGTHTVTYTITVSGCTAAMDYQTLVGVTPDATFTGLSSTYCESASVVTLSPVTAGGTFSGMGVTGTWFNPSIAGVGVHTVTYNVFDASGCQGQSVQAVEVFNSPDAAFTGLNSSYCQDNGDITLLPAESGGIFSGPGITGSTFSPSTAGLGLVAVTYQISDPNCPSQSTQTTYIFNLPIVNFSGLDADYCEQDASAVLSPSPAGGVFSGPGMNGVIFEPVGLTGTQTIQYSYTDANGCSNSITHDTEILPSPDAAFSGLQATYCKNDDVQVLVPNQTGGVFFGPGIQNSNFNPNLANLGANTIVYSITNASGCTSETSQSTSIYSVPNTSVTIIAGELSAVPQSGVTYQWIDCGTMQPIAGANTLSYLPPGIGNYAVIVSNVGCSDTSECVSYTLGVNDLSLMNWSVYPNPTSGRVTIDVPESCQLILFDATGRAVLTAPLDAGQNNVSLAEYLANGVYRATIRGAQLNESVSLVLIGQ